MLAVFFTTASQNNTALEKVAIAMHCNLKATRRRASRSGLGGQAYGLTTRLRPYRECTGVSNFYTIGLFVVELLKGIFRQSVSIMA